MLHRYSNIFYHTIGILLFLSIPILFSPDFSSDLKFLSIGGFQEDFVFHCLLLIAFYINYIFIVPKYYFGKKYFLFFILLFILFLFSFFIPKLIIGHNHEHKIGFEKHNKEHLDGSMDDRPKFDDIERPMDFEHHESEDHDMREFGRKRNFGIFQELKRVFQFILIILVGIVLQVNRRLKKVESDKISTELAYLKSQINPHFLFNTLNSIYSLAIIGSNNTANAVVKLSNMMRYVLNDASKDWVSLDEEINYISNYIELQKIRFEDAVTIEYSVDGDTDGKIVAPLLLIPFIENAFKYGVNAEQNSSIKINIDVKKTMMHVNIWNKKVEYTESSHDSHGIGIENTKSRLRLLYPNNHILSIQDSYDTYNVSLILHFI